MINHKEDLIGELTLLLLYLCSWEEKELAGAKRSWKGYPFEVLDALEKKGWLRQSKTAKSVYLTDEGVGEAMRIQKRFG